MLSAGMTVRANSIGDAENVFTFKFAIGVGIPFSLEHSSIFSVNNQNEDIVCCRLLMCLCSVSVNGVVTTTPKATGDTAMYRSNIVCSLTH